MTTSGSRFTITNLMAAASEALESVGFREVDETAFEDWEAALVRVYEDEYCIVCVAIYETWWDLFLQWTFVQAHLSDLISKNIERTDPKVWEGYLVLLTPSVVPTIDREKAISIQRDTRRVRKLFADGGELRRIDDVNRILLPLMPLEERDAQLPQNILDTLPNLLAKHGVDLEVAQVAIAAFRSQRPIIPEINAFIVQKRGQQE